MSEREPRRPTPEQPLRVGVVSISDRAAGGVYEDKGIPALMQWFADALACPWHAEQRLIADERSLIEKTLIELVDERRCHLVVTTGGTGPAIRDVTPEATLAVGERELPGFAEEMRRISRHFVPTAILSRQVAVTRGGCLIINLPGQPKAIRETLGGVSEDNAVTVEGVFAAVPYCIDLLGGPYVETHVSVVRAFRPKSAPRPADYPTG